jgi:hypothetical protein
MTIQESMIIDTYEVSVERIGDEYRKSIVLRASIFDTGQIKLAEIIFSDEWNEQRMQYGPEAISITAFYPKEEFLDVQLTLQTAKQCYMAWVSDQSPTSGGDVATFKISSNGQSAGGMRPV